ncbi:hypothetical protein BSPA111_43630 [Buttiauxella sp. A111]|nr:hypothetical protein BSPA111_43630 [Buttiauxella sp. A111]
MSFCHDECSCIDDGSSISNGDDYIKELKIIANAFMFLDEFWGRIAGEWDMDNDQKIESFSGL